MASVFIVGAAGYIGGGVASAFRRAGFRVYGLVRSEKDVAALERKEIIPVRGSLEDVASYSALLSECSIIVDAVGFRHNSGCIPFFTVVCDAASKREKASGAATVKPLFLFTSGVLVYGNVRQLTSLEPIDEFVIPKPASTDLLARFEFEKTVLHSKEVHGCVFRPGFVYGGHGVRSLRCTSTSTSTRRRLRF